MIRKNDINKFIVAICFTFVLTLLFWFSLPHIHSVNLVENKNQQSLNYPYKIAESNIDSELLTVSIQPSPIFSTLCLISAPIFVDKMFEDTKIIYSRDTMNTGIEKRIDIATSVPRGWSIKTFFLHIPQGDKLSTQMDIVSIGSGISCSIALYFSFLCAIWIRFAAKNLRFVLITGTILRAVFCASKFPAAYANDWWGHFQYVLMLAREGRIPPPSAGWECYQPPFYYWISAKVYNLASFVGISPPKTLDWMNFMLSVLFLFVSVSSANALLKSSKSKSVALAMIAFWPGIIIHSSSLNNDTFVSAFGIISLASSLFWWNERKSRFLVISAISGSLAMAAKVNGILYLCILLEFMVLAIIIERPISITLVRKFVATLLGTVMIVGLLTWSSVKRSELADNRGDPLVGNFGKLETAEPIYVIHNRVCDFSFPDFPHYFLHPFFSNDKSLTVVRNFWSFLLKSSMFGEHRLPTTINQILAEGMSICLVVICVTILFGLYSELRTQPELAVANITLIAALIAFRLKYPHPCSGDFRYIAPVILPSCLLWAKGVDATSSFRLQSLMKSVARIFVFASIYIFGTIGI